jgi:hypothetical protein
MLSRAFFGGTIAEELFLSPAMINRIQTIKLLKAAKSFTRCTAKQNIR